MFCPNCKVEYEDWVKECADCKIPLINTLPPERKMKPIEYEEILSTYNQGDIIIIKSMLDAENIIYFIKGENFTNLRPLVQPAILMVNKEQVEDAKNILKNVKLEYRSIITNDKTKNDTDTGECELRMYMEKCPYCKNEVKRKTIPKKRTSFNCKMCGKKIYVNPKQFVYPTMYLTETQSDYIGFLEQLDIWVFARGSESDYYTMQRILEKKYEREPTVAEIIWGLMEISLSEECQDKYERKMLRELMNQFEKYEEGIDPAKWLKEAKEKKKVGDLKGEIEALKKFKEEIKKTSVRYPVEYFLRLPMCLLETGENDEGWAEFNKLIHYGYPNQIKSPSTKILDCSKIYDKMRLFLQKEGKNKHAVVLGIQSYCYSCIGLYLIKYKKNLNNQMSDEYIHKILNDLLKEAKMEYLIEKCFEIIKNGIKDVCEKKDPTELINKINSAMQESN